MDQYNSLFNYPRSPSDPSLICIGVTAFCSLLLLAHYYGGQTYKLRHIPAIQLDAPFLSCLGAFRFARDGREVIESAAKKFPDAIFKVTDISRWMVVVATPKLIEEVYKAPDDVLSAWDAFDQITQAEFTLGKQISGNPYHLPIIRTQLTRTLPQVIPDVHEEIVHAFNECIPVTNNWTSVKVVANVMKIVARANNRLFVGLPLCRDPDFLELCISFTVDTIKAGIILRMFPWVLRFFVSPFLTNVPQRIRRGMKHLSPIYAARRRARAERGPDYPDKPNDLLSWLLDAAEGEEATDWYLTVRLLTLNLASIHSTSMTFAHAFYYLAAYPEYMTALREEVEEVVARDGWSKAALDQMHKVDSFIKESQRMTGLGSLLLSRVTRKDCTFSDGTTVPEGTFMTAFAPKTHFDEKVYEDPMKFDGFRFVTMKGRDTSGKKFDLVSTNLNWLPFGHGKHVCPGRFFAAAELKLMLAHIVVTYDVKLENEGVRPPDMWHGSRCIPNPTAQVLFRKRAQ